MDSTRLSMSLSFQSAVGGMRESYRSAGPLTQAQHAKVAASSAAVNEQLAAERSLERWQAYRDMHLAVAQQGGMNLFNGIDLALKDYSRIQHATDIRWLAGGPAFGATGMIARGTGAPQGSVTMLELVRAICNHFRHREQWIAERTPTNATMLRLRKAGLNPLSALAYADLLQLLSYNTWLDFEADLVSAIIQLP